MFYIISWLAVILLASSYWFQIYKIHLHKEVRDISIAYHVFLALGFGIMIPTALFEGTMVFLIKNILTFLPVCIIIFQIFYHRQDRWHDEDDPYCGNILCKKELEPQWTYCPYCSWYTKTEE